MKDSIPYLLPLLINITRYFLFAGIPFLIFYILFPKIFKQNKIQNRLAKRKDFRREILHSMQTTFILAAVALLMLKTPLRAYTQIYEHLSDYPWWWMPLSILLSLLLHDTYFYWMHRTAHHPKLFKQIHLVHHQSTNPSPWAAYSFQFAEGVLEAMVIPVILVVIPMHPIALILFAFLSFVFNVYGHLGYEIAPQWFRHSWLFEMLNTSTHHNIHHAKFNGNYGLYFRFWDRIMGTEHPDYVQSYDEIQKRRFGNHPPFVRSLQGAFLLLLVLGLGVLLMAAKSPDPIEGKWKDEQEGGLILIYEEDGLYFGQLIGADQPAENEQIQAHGKIVLLKNFEKKSSGEYCCGTIFQPKKKRTVSATLILKGKDTLEINGQYGVYRRSRIWKRQ